LGRGVTGGSAAGCLSRLDETIPVGRKPVNSAGGADSALLDSRVLALLLLEAVA
jgi:hypothetical protein